MDMTTSTPTLAKRIDQAAKEKGLYSLDAPVSGGDIGAKMEHLQLWLGKPRGVRQSTTYSIMLWKKYCVSRRSGCWTAYENV